MRWASHHCRYGDAEESAREASRAIRQELGEDSPDLVLAFFTTPIVPDADTIRSHLTEALSPGTIVGVSAAGVISTEEEIEAGPALSVIAGKLPGVDVAPFLLEGPKWLENPDDAVEFARHAPGLHGAELLLLFGDPFSLDIQTVLQAVNHHEPGLRIVGGQASAGQAQGQNAIFLNDWLGDGGGIGVALSGNLRADVVVSQGCCPIGPPLEITRARENVIQEIDSVPATERLQQVFEGMNEDEQRLARQGLLVGRPVRNRAGGRGDYLIRNLVGHDPDSGAVAVGDLVRERERIRLHARDAKTATQDLELLLAPQAFDSKATAALVFSCNGRGRNLYPEPNRDMSTLQSALGGPVPAAGFFCAGEIGPIGESNFVHGHTASIAIIRPK
jgi:small ligand-binding sensory domain FIST